MSDTALQERPTDDPDPSNDSALLGYVENASRTDGSRTPAWKIASCHQLKRAGRSVNAISGLLGMDNRTVQAVLRRSDDLILDARMLLKANALGFAGDAIQASQEAAKRGKGDVAVALLDRLGVTEPPKSQQTNQVAVQVVLNGGMLPSELSPAKVSITSETPSEIPTNEASLIRPVMVTAQAVDDQALTHDGLPQATPGGAPSVGAKASASLPATFVAEAQKVPNK